MNDQTHDPARPMEEVAADARPRVVESEQPALTRPAPRAAVWRWIAIVVALIVAAVAAWFWWGHGSADQTKAAGKGDPNARPTPIVAAPAHKGNIEVFI